MTFIYCTFYASKLYDLSNELDTTIETGNRTAGFGLSSICLLLYLTNGVVRILSLYFLVYVFEEVFMAIQPFHEKTIYIAAFPVAFYLILLHTGIIS